MVPRCIRSAVLSLALLLATASVTQAAGAPELRREAKGQDVAAMQHLLTAGGVPIAITARFGPTTEEYVRRFQEKRGLEPNGVVDTLTWASLTPVLRSGDSGHSVRALQELLVRKHGNALQVDGQYGPKTQTVVRAFQAHMGLRVTGTMDTKTWTALLAHYMGLPRKGPGWYRYATTNREGGWGTAHVIAVVEGVAKQWAAAGQVPRLGIGDIGLPHGGPIPGHASHQREVDVDIRIVRDDGREGVVDYRDPAHSRKLTQRLADLLIATGEVELILFNDPEIKGVTPWPNQDHHMHVRSKR